MEKSNVSKKDNTTPELLDVIRPMDICCGRGKGWINHPGNVQFQEIIQANHQIYKSSETKNGKSRVVARIVSEIQASGYRFVKKHKDSGKWYVISRAQAHEKTGHAIRDFILNQSKRRQAKKAIERTKTRKVDAFRNENILPQEELSSSKTIEEENVLPPVPEESIRSTTTVSGEIDPSDETDKNCPVTDKVLSSDSDNSGDLRQFISVATCSGDWPLPIMESEATCSSSNNKNKNNRARLRAMKEEQEPSLSNQENKEKSLSFDPFYEEEAKLCPSDSKNVSIWNKTFTPSRQSFSMKEVLGVCPLPLDYEGSNDFSIAIEGLWHHFELSN